MADSDARLIWELYAAALKHDPAERGEYLERACTDPAIRAQVASLLESHGLELGPSTRSDSLRTSKPETTTRIAGDVSLAGRQTGNYVVEPEIGGGGMAIAYLAQDVRWPRTVAIKALSPAYGRPRSVRQR